MYGLKIACTLPTFRALHSSKNGHLYHCRHEQLRLPVLTMHGVSPTLARSSTVYVQKYVVEHKDPFLCLTRPIYRSHLASPVPFVLTAKPGYVSPSPCFRLVCTQPKSKCGSLSTEERKLTIAWKMPIKGKLDVVSLQGTKNIDSGSRRMRILGVLMSQRCSKLPQTLASFGWGGWEAKESTLDFISCSTQSSQLKIACHDSFSVHLIKAVIVPGRIHLGKLRIYHRQLNKASSRWFSSLKRLKRLIYNDCWI